MSSELRVHFAGEDHRLLPHETFSFGRARSTDLQIDDNPRLHRQLGRLRYHGEQWWLDNIGSRMLLTLHDRHSPSSTVLAHGSTTPILFAQSSVRFSAGGISYELDLDIETAEQTDADDARSHFLTTSNTTIDPLAVRLTDKQRLLLAALCEHTLHSPSTVILIPANKAVAARLGWSITTFNRALDRLCAKLAASGVRGLVGSAGLLATDRRRRLVEHAIETGLITAHDLTLLDAAPDGD